MSPAALPATTSVRHAQGLAPCAQRMLWVDRPLS